MAWFRCKSSLFDLADLRGDVGKVRLHSLESLLARAGHRVLVLERERFPRYHIGESLLSATLPILAHGTFDAVQLFVFLPVVLKLLP